MRFEIYKARICNEYGMALHICSIAHVLMLLVFDNRKSATQLVKRPMQALTPTTSAFP